MISSASGLSGLTSRAGVLLAHSRLGVLIVGELDAPVLRMNREAMARMAAPARLEIVPAATHLFEEPGTLEQVALAHPDDAAGAGQLGALLAPHRAVAGEDP